MTFLLPPIPWSIVIALLVSACAIGVAAVPLRSWSGLLAAPILLSLLTAAALLIEFDIHALSWSVHWVDPTFWLAVSVFLRSTAALCSIAFVGSTTPAMDLLALLHGIGIPRELLDLAAMIYRFLVVAAKTLREMRLAQSWRMGDSSWRAEMRAASFLTSALFIRCIERAKRLELGLAARGYTGALHLLRCEKQPSPAVIGSVLLLQGVLLALASWVHGGGPWKFR